ncbi:MAG: glutaredoxin family protein [Chromatocurvus sp.]
MRVIIRYFFRTLRLLLMPFVLIYEKLTTPKAVARQPDDQAAIDSAASDLALYQFRSCPFCIRVRKELARLGVDLELRDAQHDPAHRADLEAGGGRVKVPCLRIAGESGHDEWLYESDAINAWLRQRFEPDSANA